MGNKSRAVTMLGSVFLVLLVVRVDGQGQGKTPVKSYKTVATNQSQNQNQTTPAKHHHVVRHYPPFEDESRFCLADLPFKHRPFYRSQLDGSVCCRGNTVDAITITPETEGECAISTKKDANGMINPAPLWCAYTCSLKKLGVMDATGNIKPEEFFNHLAKPLGPHSKEEVKLLMEKHFKCMKPFKNPKFPCYTPLGFHKCYLDALEHLCKHGMPKDHDFSKLTAVNNDYVNFSPACKWDGKQVMAHCCHGKPLPWSIADLVEAPQNQPLVNTCMDNMKSLDCQATCFMRSVGVVNDSMEIDVDKFSSSLLKLFPDVQPSIWMNFYGPTYVFFDEILDELHEMKPTSLRVCLFHDKILNLHEDKIFEYCAMTPEQVKDMKKLSE